MFLTYLGSGISVKNSHHVTEKRRSRSKPVVFFRKGLSGLFDERPQFGLGSEPEKENDAQKQQEISRSKKNGGRRYSGLA